MRNQLHIAMLEDDSDDRYLTEEVLAGIGFTVNIEFYSDSSKLLQALSLSPKPNLILVDFNSNPDNGIEVLKKIKSSDDLKSIPVVILSDSDLPKYRKQCYAEGASTLVRKPSTLSETKQKIGSFFNYWTQVAEL